MCEISKYTFEDYILSELSVDEYCTTYRIDANEFREYAKTELKSEDFILYRKYILLSKIYDSGEIDTYRYYNDILREYVYGEITLGELLEIKGIKYNKISNYVSRQLSLLDNELYEQYKAKSTLFRNFSRLKLQYNDLYDSIVNEYINSNSTLVSICNNYDVKSSVVYRYIYYYIKKNDTELYTSYIERHKK